MVNKEIGLYGKKYMLEVFAPQGFDMYGVEDIETFPGYRHGSLSRAFPGCKDMGTKLHSDAITQNSAEYAYGQDSPMHIRLVPLCLCNRGDREAGKPSGEAALRAFRCSVQFAFVR